MRGPFPGLCFMALLCLSSSHTPTRTRSPWAWSQRSIPTGAHMLLPDYILMIQDPKFPAQTSPSPFLGLLSLGFLSSLVHTEVRPCQRCAHSWTKKWLRGGHLQDAEGVRIGFACVGLGSPQSCTQGPWGWSPEWRGREAGCEPETWYQLSPAKPCCTPEPQGLWEF